jgi:hypothetical protein
MDVNLISDGDFADEGRTTEDAPPAKTEKNPAAVELGRLGGLKGGKARAEKLSARRRSQIARKAAQARWGNNPSE